MNLKSFVPPAITAFVLLTALMACFASAGLRYTGNDGYGIVVGVSLWDMRDAQTLKMQQEILDSAKKDETVNVIFKDAGKSFEKQNNDIYELLDMGIDALILTPPEKLEYMTPALHEVLDKNVPVVSVSNLESVPGSTVQICMDDSWLGYIAGKYVCELAGGKPFTLLEVQGDMDEMAARNRHNGFRRAIEKSGNSEIKVSRVVGGYWLRDKAEENIADSGMIQLAGELDAIFAHNDEMAIGAYQAFKNSGKDIPIIGIGGMWSDGLEAVELGHIAATIYHSSAGDLAYGTAMSLLSGTKRPDKIYMGAICIDKTNLEVTRRDENR